MRLIGWLAVGCAAPLEPRICPQLVLRRYVEAHGGPLIILIR
jgi:hypothetical protein